MKKLHIVAATIAMAFTGTITHAFAQGGINVPAGQVIVCVIQCEGHVVVAGHVVNAAASGNAQFVSLGGGNDDQTVNSCSFSPVSLTVSGSDPVYGTYTFHLDASRPAPTTTVTANQAGNDFPATGDVYANVIGTISGLPGTFTNDSPCHMRSTNLQTFNPHVNERYLFVNDVTFTGDDGTTAFTIPANAEVTLN